MAKTVSSYCTKVIGEERIFRETVSLYRKALTFLMGVVSAEWDSGLKEVYQVSANKAQRAVELLTHASKNNTPKYADFDVLFYKFPCYLRRAAITDSLGAVSSYRSSLERWEKAGKRGKAPKIQVARNAMPTFYRDGMYKRPAGGEIVFLKLFRKNDWVWVPVRLRKQDTDYIRERWAHVKGSAPTLVKRNRRYALCFSFEEQVSFEEKPIDSQTILSVGLGVNSDAVCSVMRSDGTVLARKFIDFPSEKDRMETQLGRARRGRHEHGYRGDSSYMRKAGCLNEDHARKVASEIVHYALAEGTDVIVMEHLHVNRSLSTARHMDIWRKRDIQGIVTHQAHRSGIRVRLINYLNTNQLAFDGSGQVQWEDAGSTLCRFSSGKQYNSDLNASYNIGARYFIRELLKSVPETERSRLTAKVPEAERRTQCTLSTLLRLRTALAPNRCAAAEPGLHGGDESRP